MSGQSGTGLAATIDDVRLRPFLPLIYVAWSEGEFSADEATGICEVVAGYTGIDLDCKKALEQWLDVEYPPTPDELESLRIRIAGWAEGLDLARDLSVSELGIAIATSTRQETDVTNDESEALNEIQNRYGPLGPVPSALGSLIRLRTIARREAPFDVSKMSEILDGRHKDIRNKVREILSRPQFTYVEGITGDDYREWVLDRIRVLADEGLGVLSYPTPYGHADVGTFVAAFATLGHHDLSVMTKFGVQFGLFGGAIARLGTKRHHDAYLSAAGSLEIPGCFAMTETGHGSNVRDLETVATFDKTRDEFIVNTPHDLARKDYIGNAAAHGQLAVVFARLVVGDTDH